LNDLIEAGRELEHAIEQGVALFEELEASEVARVIPGIGHFVRVWKKVNDIRSRLLAAKLRKFVTDPSLQSEKAKQRMRERAGSEEAKKIGETLFLVLDKLTDMQKPVLLAKVFAGYLDGEMSASDLRRLCDAIDAAFTDDLMQLLNTTDESKLWKRYLASSGLTFLIVGSWGDSPDPYELSPLGELFIRTVKAR
jgi:hypothetical protein